VTALTTTNTASALVPQDMNSAMRMAEMMANGRLVPQHLQKSPADCLMVIEQAMRWGMSPFAVAQATSVVQGKLMYEGKLVAAALHTSGALASRLDYDYSGTGDDRVVTVSATRVGESSPRSIMARLGDVKTNNKVWQTQPDQQLSYAGARIWARRYCPEVMLGVYAPEEMPAPAARPEPVDTSPVIDAVAEPAPPVDRAREGADRLIARFNAVQTDDDMHAIVTDTRVGSWLTKAKDDRPELHAEVIAAQAAANRRLAEARGDGEIPMEVG